MPLQLVEQLDNLYTSTWMSIKKEIVDNIFNATPFWFWLTQKGHRETVEGGRAIVEPLMYGKNTSVKSFSRGDTFSLTDDQILTEAIFPWKYVGGSVVRYWEDDQKNRGKAQIFNLLNAKLENLKLSLIDQLEQMVFSDGTGNSGKDIDGLQKLIRSTAPTGAGQDVVGGIDSYTYTWWRNKIKAASGAFSTTGVKDMRNLFNSCSVGNDMPDFIITTQEVYEAYEDELLEIYRVTDKKLADAGFESLTFKGRPITYAPSCPANTLYMINSRYLKWKADEFANFDMTEWKPVQNSLDRAAQVVVAGNLTCSNRSRQGVLTGITF